MENSKDSSRIVIFQHIMRGKTYKEIYCRKVIKDYGTYISVPGHEIETTLTKKSIKILN